MMKREEIHDFEDNNAPVFTVGIAAKLVGTTIQTLRHYEKHGLVRPVRGSRNRAYSENDIRRLRCIRELIHIRKFSIEAIKKLLNYAPCWQIKGCPEDMRLSCSFTFEDACGDDSPEKAKTQPITSLCLPTP